MVMTEATVRVGVQAIVERNGGVLVVQRGRGFGFGLWGLPGGHLEPGETIVQCALRELYEETGLRGYAPQVVVITDPSAEANNHMQIGVRTDALGMPSAPEDVQEISAVRFTCFDKLPDNLFRPSAEILEKYLAGRLY
jgi:8-oxo-dGTP diphosphatase